LPKVNMVVQINDNTPIRDNFNILFIIQNIASNEPFKKSLTGCAFLPMADNAIPKNTAKNIIGNNSPAVKASKKFCGTMFTIVSIKWLPYVDSSAAFADDSYVEISPFGSLLGFNQLPGLNIFAKSMPSPIATVVIISKYKIVLKP